MLTIVRAPGVAGLDGHFLVVHESGRIVFGGLEHQCLEFCIDTVGLGGFKEAGA